MNRMINMQEDKNKADRRRRDPLPISKREDICCSFRTQGAGRKRRTPCAEEMEPGSFFLLRAFFRDQGGLKLFVARFRTLYRRRRRMVSYRLDIECVTQLY
jgi:hypothetical protein